MAFSWNQVDGTQVVRRFVDPVVFCKVRDPWGGLSNMSNVFPLMVNGVRVPSSEALYQAMRFPHEPAWQQEILSAGHAMQAKMVAKKDGRRANFSRPDFDEIRVDVMRWALRIKLAQHQETFGALLIESGDRAIVEFSKKDDFWGAKPDGVEPTRLVGTNMLGRLLMELRDEYIAAGAECVRVVVPPSVPMILLLGEEVQPVGDKEVAVAGTLA